MEIDLPEILQTFYPAEFLLFVRVKYSPLPLFDELLTVRSPEIKRLKYERLIRT